MPICTWDMQRTWWPEASALIVTGPYCMLGMLSVDHHWHYYPGTRPFLSSHCNWFVDGTRKSFEDQVPVTFIYEYSIFKWLAHLLVPNLHIRVVVNWFTERIPGPRLNVNPVFPGVGIAITKIRRSWDCLIFIMGIPILVRRHRYIEMSPGLLVLIMAARLTCPIENSLYSHLRLQVPIRHAWRAYCWWDKIGWRWPFVSLEDWSPTGARTPHPRYAAKLLHAPATGYLPHYVVLLPCHRLSGTRNARYPHGCRLPWS